MRGGEAAMPITAVLFDADGHDTRMEGAAALPEPGEHQLLWVDVQGADAAALAREVGALPLEAAAREFLCRPDLRPALHHREHQVLLSVSGVQKGEHRYVAVPLNIVAGQGVVFTARVGAVEFLDQFRQNLQDDSQLGRLDSAAFLAVLLYQHIEGYHRLLTPLEDSIDRLDEGILHERGRDRQHLETLVALRRRVSDLRRLLSVHRLVYAGLASPDFVVFAGDQPEAMLTRLFGQYERAQEAIGHTRDMMLGSFDLHMTHTGQRTNEIMRVLTVVTVALGLIAAVAGLMGMNFQADIFKSGNVGFRDVLLLSAGLIVATVGLGRWRGWL